jgi:Antp family protein
MNSYFEQGGFYGQTAAGTAAAGAATASDQAAYRFPLGLGMGVSPYSQHNAAAAAAAAQSSRHHESQYAAAAAAAAALDQGGGGGQTSPKLASSLYSPLSDSSYKATNSAPTNSAVAASGSSNNSVSSAGGGGGGGGNNGSTGATDCKDQNGYSSLSKDVIASANSSSLNNPSSWNSGGSGNGGGVTPPVRPSAGTPPDHMSRYTPSAADVAARERWMNTCSLTQSAAAAQHQQLQQASQSANHTFYPWMAIAGESVRDLERD